MSLIKIQSELKAPKVLLSYIRENFIYNSETGQINRTDRRNSNGSFDKDGYLIIKVKKTQFKAHRLAWFLFYGCFPNGEIDHINRVRTDNRITNLRECSRADNVRNTTPKINKNTGVVGVYIDNTNGLKKRYTTKIFGKTYRFYSVSEAIKFRNINYYGKINEDSKRVEITQESVK